MSEDLQAKKRARDDLNDIEALKKFAPFERWFLRRVNEELKKFEVKILTDRGLTPEKLHEERLAYLGARDISLGLIEREEATCRKLLGVDAGGED